MRKIRLTDDDFLQIICKMLFIFPKKRLAYNPDIHHRRSVRLKGYDYSQAGLYFVTICVKDRVAAFGTVTDGNMHLSEKGEIAQQVWNALPERFPYLEIDYFVIMPDHVHGIL